MLFTSAPSVYNVIRLSEMRPFALSNFLNAHELGVPRKILARFIKNRYEWRVGNEQKNSGTPSLHHRRKADENRGFQSEKKPRHLRKSPYLELEEVERGDVIKGEETGKTKARGWFGLMRHVEEYWTVPIILGRPTVT